METLVFVMNLMNYISIFIVKPKCNIIYEIKEKYEEFENCSSCNDVVLKKIKITQKLGNIEDAYYRDIGVVRIPDWF